MMVDVLADLDSYPPVTQPEAGVTYAPKITKDEAQIDWTRPAHEFQRHVQGLAPFPGAWFEFAGERIKLLDAEISEGYGDPGEVIDEHLTIACGEMAPSRNYGPARRQGRDARRRPAARLPNTQGNQPSVTRWRLTIEYDGGPFFGWQRQNDAPTVQKAIEDAIRQMTGEENRVHCAGRTDAGVHGLAMTAHVDIAKPMTAFRLREAMNALVRPDPITILAAEEVADDWHARFSCIERRYLYRILNRRPPPALDRGRVWHIAQADRHRRDGRGRSGT